MKTDARIRYTRMRIKEAFLQCLREKPVNKITVKEICDLAEINRATFYAHYENPFDLLQRLEEETLDSIREQIDEALASGEDLLEKVICSLADRQSEGLLLASSNADPEFSVRISELFQSKYLDTMVTRIPRLSPQERQQAYRFLTGGCSNMIRHWMEGEGPRDPAEMTECLRKMCEAFLSSLAR